MSSPISEISKHRAIVALLCLICVPLIADYGDIPATQKLDLKFGVERFYTDENFDLDGIRTPLTAGRYATQLDDWALWFFSEYGVAQNWSASIYTSWLFSTLHYSGSNQSLADGSGLGDTSVSIKWAISQSDRALALETWLKLPTGNHQPETAETSGQLVTGDGQVDLGFALHGAARISVFRFFVSPALIFKFGGHSSALAADTGVQLEFARGFLRGFSKIFYSLSEGNVVGGRPAQQSSPGSGGSYAKLAPSPTLFSVGGKLGVLLMRHVALETYVEQSLLGRTAPYGTRFGLNVVLSFDIVEPKTSVRIREVPFLEED